jgi:hypothetical protein
MTDIQTIELGEARRRLDRVKSGVERIWDDMVALYRGRAWIALGYASWDALCDSELGGARIALPRQQRQEVVCDLRQSGMSTRAIASAVGFDHATVARDIASSTVANATLEAVTGLDGRIRTVPTTSPTKPVEPIEPWNPTESFQADELEAMSHAIQAAPLTEIINQLDEISRDAERFALPRIIDDSGQPLPLAAHHIDQLNSTAARLRETANHIETYIRSNS